MAVVGSSASSTIPERDEDQLGTLPPGTLVLCYYPPNPYWVARVMGYREASAQYRLQDRRGSLERLRRGEEAGVAVYFFGESTVAILPVDLVEPHACVQGPHAGAFRHWIWSASLSEQVARDWPAFSLDVRIRWNKAFDTANLYATRCVHACKAYGHLPKPPFPIYPCMRDPPQFHVIDGCEYCEGAEKNGHLPTGSLIWCCVEDEPIWPCRVIALPRNHYNSLRQEAEREGYAATEKTEPVLFFGEDSMTPPPPPVLASLSDCAVFIPGEDKQWIPHYRLRSQKVAKDRKWGAEWDEDIWASWEVACEIACDCAKAGSIRPVLDWMSVPDSKTENGTVLATTPEEPVSAIAVPSGCVNRDEQHGNSPHETEEYPSSSSRSSSASGRRPREHDSPRQDYSEGCSNSAKRRKLCSSNPEPNGQGEITPDSRDDREPVLLSPLDTDFPLEFSGNELASTTAAAPSGEEGDFNCYLQIGLHLDEIADEELSFGAAEDRIIAGDNDGASESASDETESRTCDEKEKFANGSIIENDVIGETSWGASKHKLAKEADFANNHELEGIREAARRISASLSKRGCTSRVSKRCRPPVERTSKCVAARFKAIGKQPTNTFENRQEPHACDDDIGRARSNAQRDCHDSSSSTNSGESTVRKEFRSKSPEPSKNKSSPSNDRKCSSMPVSTRETPDTRAADVSPESVRCAEGRFLGHQRHDASPASKSNSDAGSRKFMTGIADIYDEWY